MLQAPSPPSLSSKLFLFCICGCSRVALNHHMFFLFLLIVIVTHSPVAIQLLK